MLNSLSGNAGRPRHRPRWACPAAVGVLLVCLSACTHHQPAPLEGRRLEPPPRWLRPTFDGWEFESKPLQRRHHVEEFSFRTYDDVQGRYLECRGELWLPPGKGPYPLIVVMPILGGAILNYLECRVFSRAALDRGYASFFLFQDEVVLKPYLDAVALEQMQRSDIRTTIKALDLIVSHYSIDPLRLGSFGISLGGIRVVLLAAAEPRLRANVVCLGGGDVGSIFRSTREPLVRTYLNRRVEVALCSPEQIFVDLETHLYSDPLRVARSVDPRRVLLFLARFDRHVPIRNGWELYHALGRPELRMSPLGHYSSVLVISWALRHSLDYFDRLLGS